MRRRLGAWLIAIASILIIWQGALSFHLVSRAALADPMEVAVSLPKVFTPTIDGEFNTGNRDDVKSTVAKSLLAFVLSIPIGLLAGIAVFYGGEAAAPGRFILDFLRSVPATALVPIFFILIGQHDSTKVVVGAFSSALIIALATVTGLQGRNLTRLAVARTMGLRGRRRVLLLDIPEAGPHIFLGMRAGISLALILVVVTEMVIGSNHGLGKLINDMRYSDDKGRMYAALIVTGVIGYAYNLTLIAVERYVLHWQGK